MEHYAVSTPPAAARIVSRSGLHAPQTRQPVPVQVWKRKGPGSDEQWLEEQGQVAIAKVQEQLAQVQQMRSSWEAAAMQHAQLLQQIGHGVKHGMLPAPRNMQPQLPQYQQPGTTTRTGSSMHIEQPQAQPATGADRLRLIASVAAERAAQRGLVRGRLDPAVMALKGGLGRMEVVVHDINTRLQDQYEDNPQLWQSLYKEYLQEQTQAAAMEAEAQQQQQQQLSQQEQQYQQLQQQFYDMPSQQQYQTPPLPQQTGTPLPTHQQQQVRQYGQVQQQQPLPQQPQAGQGNQPLPHYQPHHPHHLPSQQQPLQQLLPHQLQSPHQYHHQQPPPQQYQHQQSCQYHKQ